VQSAPVRDRNTLEEAVAELRRRHPDGRVPKPPAWGGYRLRPHRYEFWQGREGRLHDRFQYAWTGAVWRVSRLQP
jgi:pyridoxamine 5'-phosphate oxidase